MRTSTLHLQYEFSILLSPQKYWNITLTYFSILSQELCRNAMTTLNETMHKLLYEVSILCPQKYRNITLTCFSILSQELCRNVIATLPADIILLIAYRIAYCFVGTVCEFSVMVLTEILVQTCFGYI